MLGKLEKILLIIELVLFFSTTILAQSLDQTIQTNSQGNAIYKTIAQKSGPNAFTINTSKNGYQETTKTVKTTVNELKPIQVIVWNLQGLPVENAQILIDNKLSGTTKKNGTFNLKMNSGFHLIEVKNGFGTKCSSKTIDLSNSNGLSFICQTGNLVVQVKSFDGLPLANAYVFIDDLNKGFTNADGMLYLKGIDFGSHNVSVFLKAKNKADDVDLHIFKADKTFNFNKNYDTLNFSANEFSPYSSTNSASIHSKAIVLDDVMLLGTIFIVGTIAYKTIISPTLEEISSYQNECTNNYQLTGNWSRPCTEEALFLGGFLVMIATENVKTPKFAENIEGIGVKTIEEIPATSTLKTQFDKIKVFYENKTMWLTQKIESGIWKTAKLNPQQYNTFTNTRNIYGTGVNKIFETTQPTEFEKLMTNLPEIENVPGNQTIKNNLFNNQELSNMTTIEIGTNLKRQGKTIEFEITLKSGNKPDILDKTGKELIEVKKPEAILDADKIKDLISKAHEQLSTAPGEFVGYSKKLTIDVRTDTGATSTVKGGTDLSETEIRKEIQENFWLKDGSAYNTNIDVVEVITDTQKIIEPR